MKKVFNSSKLPLLFFCLLAPTMIWAQTSCPPAQAPVDGGLSLLAGVGIAGYVGKKIAEKRNARKK